jgi:hypothetical protein
MKKLMYIYTTIKSNQNGGSKFIKRFLKPTKNENKRTKNHPGITYYNPKVGNFSIPFENTASALPSSSSSSSSPAQQLYVAYKPKKSEQPPPITYSTYNPPAQQTKEAEKNIKNIKNIINELYKFLHSLETNEHKLKIINDKLFNLSETIDQKLKITEQLRNQQRGKNN